ncbi:MAG: poly-gamma-glutamate hydrolase family protein [Microvirga sp.]
MADRYGNFEELRQNEREGVDFRICLTPRNSPAAIIAPHGGEIEPGTSHIASAVAGDRHDLYCFEGLRRRRHLDLHITSTNFDEPRCLETISSCDVVISVHGIQGEEDAIDVGGRDKELRDMISQELTNSGFPAQIVTTGSHAGTSRRNICNRGRSGAGVQIEITDSLRDSLVTRRQDLIAFANAVQLAVTANTSAD